MEIAFSVGGSVDSLDYELTTNTITVESGVSGSIDIVIRDDYQVEVDEELILTFVNTVNSAGYNSHTIIISEDNIVPKATLSLTQEGDKVSSIILDRGEAILNLSIDDGNIDDQHDINWDIPSTVSASISANELIVTLEPNDFNLSEEDKGLISISVTVTDNGDGGLAHTEIINIQDRRRFFSLCLYTIKRILYYAPSHQKNQLTKQL